MNQTVTAIEHLTDRFPGIVAPEIDIDKRHPGRRCFQRLKNIDQVIEAAIRHHRLTPLTGLAVTIPVVDPGHDFKKCTFTALGKPQNSHFHNLTPLEKCARISASGRINKNNYKNKGNNRPPPSENICLQNNTKMYYNVNHYEELP